MWSRQQCRDIPVLSIHVYVLIFVYLNWLLSVIASAIKLLSLSYVLQLTLSLVLLMAYMYTTVSRTLRVCVACTLHMHDRILIAQAYQRCHRSLAHQLHIKHRIHTINSVIYRSRRTIVVLILKRRLPAAILQNK